MSFTSFPSGMIFVGLIITSLMGGCRATPAPDAGFLQSSKLMKSDGTVPFNRIWVNSKYREKQYAKIYVVPVNTDYLIKENLWEMASLANLSPEYVRQNIAMLADYQHNALIAAVKRDSHGKMSVVDRPDADTLILEMAIVQLVPSKPVMQAASYYSWIATVVMIGGSVATRSDDQGKGVVAMEARTRDGGTGEVTSMFADREHPPAAIIDVKALFWWEPAKPICDGWARQIVEMESCPKGTRIDEIPNFQWLVW